MESSKSEDISELSKLSLPKQLKLFYDLGYQIEIEQNETRKKDYEELKEILCGGGKVRSDLWAITQSDQANSQQKGQACFALGFSRVDRLQDIARVLSNGYLTYKNELTGFLFLKEQSSHYPEKAKEIIKGLLASKDPKIQKATFNLIERTKTLRTLLEDLKREEKYTVPKQQPIEEKKLKVEEKGLKVEERELKAEEKELMAKLENLTEIVMNLSYWKQRDNPDAILKARKILKSRNEQDPEHKDIELAEKAWNEIKLAVTKSEEEDALKSIKKGFKFLISSTSDLFSKEKKEYHYRDPKTQELYDLLSEKQKPVTVGDLSNFAAKMKSELTEVKEDIPRLRQSGSDDDL